MISEREKRATGNTRPGKVRGITCIEKTVTGRQAMLGDGREREVTELEKKKGSRFVHVGLGRGNGGFTARKG